MTRSISEIVIALNTLARENPSVSISFTHKKNLGWYYEAEIGKSSISGSREFLHEIIADVEAFLGGQV